MSITAAFVLYAVVWFMLFLIILPMRLKTQGETGEIVPGTHASAPVNPDIKRKVKITTLVAIVIWGVLATIILTGAITVSDFDWFNELG